MHAVVKMESSLCLCNKFLSQVSEVSISAI